jgi:hypothetical protein
MTRRPTRHRRVQPRNRASGEDLESPTPSREREPAPGYGLLSLTCCCQIFRAAHAHHACHHASSASSRKTRSGL